MTDLSPARQPHLSPARQPDLSPARQPVFFIPHGGGPCFFMDWDPPGTWDAMAAWLRSIPDALPEQPRAIVVVSAHWEGEVVSVTGGANPSLVYDYGGFPPHTYELSYPAPGEPALAHRIAGLLDAAGIANRVDDDRGWDHGVFIPLLVAFPHADVPVVEVSLHAGLDPAEHVAIGRALARLRDEGVLLIGSGMSYHNLRGFGPVGGDVSRTFDAWLTATLEDEPATRDAGLARWVEAPSARAAHPREEHLIPAMVMAGAAGDDRGRRTYDDDVLGLQISGYVFGA